MLNLYSQTEWSKALLQKLNFNTVKVKQKFNKRKSNLLPDEEEGTIQLIQPNLNSLKKGRSTITNINLFGKPASIESGSCHRGLLGSNGPPTKLDNTILYIQPVGKTLLARFRTRYLIGRYYWKWRRYAERARCNRYNDNCIRSLLECDVHIGLV